ncbi:MAG: hypothetical protein E7652_04690 [Ruminococcaceae bacterium]|nr:hypothetical protein [Oscillospiraceae bacterium]
MKNDKMSDKVTIKLPRISGREESVYVSVGEQSWRIRRGCEVEIPLCAYDVLRNSELAEDKACAYMERIH